MATDFGYLGVKGKVATTPAYAAPGTELVARFGTANDLLISQLRGKYAELVRNAKVFTHSVAAVTLPVKASNLVSVMAIYNPPGSGVNVEFLDVEAHAVLAATVVDGIGIYADSTTALAQAATFTTQVSPVNRLIGGPSGGAARCYSALTHSGTPVLVALVGGWGAVTDGGSTAIRKEFDGGLILPPGFSVSLAMTTAASTGSGITAAITYAEIPIQ